MCLLANTMQSKCPSVYESENKVIGKLKVNFARKAAHDFSLGLVASLYCTNLHHKQYSFWSSLVLV